MSSKTKKKSKYGENNEDLPENLVRVLKDLVTKYEEEDSWVRKQMVKMWKKNDEFWHGIQFIFWSESRQDWLSPTETRWFQQDEGREESEGPFYDFVVNIYKAHGESIIAALSAQIPAVRFPPDDADDDEDVQTSRTYSKIADLIQRHNQAKLVMLRALFMLWNQGTVFGYVAPKADKAFGTINVPNYKNTLTCPQCEKDKPIPEDSDIDEEAPCPTCGTPMTIVPVLDGFTETPKVRTIIEIFGPLFVKFPYYARTQKEGGYLSLRVDQPKALLANTYPHIADKIDQDRTGTDSFERMARTPSSFSSSTTVDENKNNRTLHRFWGRPWIFDGIPKDYEKEAKELKKLFPSGVYIGMVEKTYAESRDEDFDKYWEIGQAGLSTFIHSDALGQPLISIQELKNVHVNLAEETIEHGIPSTFADPEVLDFTTYSRKEARPGFIYPATAKAGQTLNQGFYESPRATISKEMAYIDKQLEADGQFVVGDYPSVYGGPMEGKSRTASEYNQSRSAALNRMSICYSLFCMWWARLMEKAVKIYVENLVEDEKFTKLENNNYVNVWIRKSQLEGHVGEVEPESSESFPISTPQKQQLLMRLMEMNNEFLNAALYDNKNRRLIGDSLGFPDFQIPGEDQRVKQVQEIQQMIKLNEAALKNISQGPMLGFGGPVAPPTPQTIPIEPLVDDNAIHFTTCQNFLVEESGLDLKKTNPLAYQAIVEHMTLHHQAIQEQMMQQALQQQQPGAPKPQVQ